MEALSSAQNPHEGGGVEREIAAGGKELKKFAGTICSLCGGTNTSGYKHARNESTNIKACLYSNRYEGGDVIVARASYSLHQ